jgi:hypothetical protein
MIRVWRDAELFYLVRVGAVPAEVQVCLPIDLFELIAELGGLDLDDREQAAEAIRLAALAQQRLTTGEVDDQLLDAAGEARWAGRVDLRCGGFRAERRDRAPGRARNHSRARPAAPQRHLPPAVAGRPDRAATCCAEQMTYEAGQIPAAAAGIVHCAHCGDVIGVYEPTTWLLIDGTRIDASIAARPAARYPAGVVSMLHRSCARPDASPR